MQTQSISLNVSAMQSMSTGKSTKVKESAFDNFMSRNASGASVKKQESVSVKKPETKLGKNGSDVGSSSDDFNRHKISLTSGNQQKNDWTETVDMEEIGEEVVLVLKNTFGMSEEDIVDILEQLGLTPVDLAFLVAADFNTVTLINVENIKAFIMEAHGVEDANLFLTSDIMSGEFNDIMSEIQNLLEDAMGMDLENLSQDDNVLLQSFAEKLGQIVNNADENVQNAAADEPSEDMMQIAASGNEDEIPVVVEMSEESGLSDEYQDSRQPRSEGIQRGQNESPLNAFVDHLTQSFENVMQEETVSSDVSMTNIVEQVVNHIRIRVLPQTTSMELQLNPESLGRVNLQVTSNNGRAMATLTVQNQVAKEALESQLTVLRENLESHGLKVDAVEVNVSDFGFKNQENANGNQYRQKKTPGRKLRFDETKGVEEEVSAENTEEVQSGDSVVNYTA